MELGLIGRKVGMTRIFTPEGDSIPVSVLEMKDNIITQVKTLEKDGYRAIQVTTGEKKASRINKPEAGVFAKSGVGPGRGLWEFRLGASEGADLVVGAKLTAEMFKEGQIVDVIGTSKGKGFAGCVKRHNFKTQGTSHGNSLSNRAPGSIGQNQTPGRVFKGKKMAGHMGAVRCTVQNLQVVRIDTQLNVILVRGAVPGAINSDVMIMPSVKAPNATAAA